ncbi:RNase III domain-containing protein [Astrocystis sublimbata]|nr:RNase III domain-containing protein [Astrocystis sublimbata]
MSPNTSRSAVSLSRQALRHYKSQKVSFIAAASSRALTTSPSSRSSEAAIEAPRWSYTPSRMKAPVSHNGHLTVDPARSVWQVNESPEKLDDALEALLGRDGPRMLPEELKWLAVTHKTFDQGRRGFNERLSFLGRQICVQEALQVIITSPSLKHKLPADPYADLRQPFEDPALQNIDNLTKFQPNDIFTHDKVTRLALETGLTEVMRWKPRMPENIRSSGYNVIMASGVYALVGAVALQNGGKVASRIVRDRIMKRLR